MQRCREACYQQLRIICFQDSRIAVEMPAVFLPSPLASDGWEANYVVHLLRLARNRSLAAHKIAR